MANGYLDGLQLVFIFSLVYVASAVPCLPDTPLVLRTQSRVYRTKPITHKDILFLQRIKKDASQNLYHRRFSLAMDYELFIVSRIQEVYERTGDTRKAIIHGLESSGRSVTMAAVLLAVVVGAFVASKIITIKMIGLGIALSAVIGKTAGISSWERLQCTYIVGSEYRAGCHCQT
jgi:hypothetical protein